MAVPRWLQLGFMNTVDAAMACVPRSRPTRESLSRCRIIAHRGSPKTGILENSVEAFAAAIEDGAWAIEFDVRWTKDDVPVIYHDRDLARLFGNETVLADTEFEKLRAARPEIATLEEVVAKFGRRAHLMIELKREREDLSRKRLDIFKDHLRDLTPATDFHLMSLHAPSLLACEFVPRRAMLPVAEINVSEVSALALKEKLAGFSGQYALTGAKIVARHLEAGQIVGTGFINSRSVLRRELSRGVNWIFTNHAREVKQLLESELSLAESARA